MNSFDRPLVIAGPCMAEDLDLMEKVCAHMVELSKELNFQYVFKASYDKANRSSTSSYRGPGLEQGLEWLGKIKKKYHVPVLTDIHEASQAAKVAEVCDYLQIPAFLCRQTDLLVAAVETGAFVNIKKGQFLVPAAMAEIVNKAKEAAENKGIPLRVAVCERGASFGYGNLVVDMRSLATMAESKAPVIFDITHSTQLPASGGKTSSGERRFAPLIARSAAASGYLSGFFLEVHTNPSQAKSDSDVQLTMAQADALLRQTLPVWENAKEFAELDKSFT